MTPYYSDALATIYHGDCVEVLRSMPHSSVDLVLTDAPYGISYMSNARARHDVLRVPVEGDHSLDALTDVVPQLHRVLAQDRHFYVFASPRMLPGAQEAVSTLGSGLKQVLAWDKGDGGTIGDLKSGFAEAWEAILYGMKGRRQLFGKRPRTVIRSDWNSTRDPVHPTVKPVDLLMLLIGWSSMEGEVVLDPFMGSGPTLAAATNLGRRSIGVEIEERYCEIAAERLSQCVFALGDGGRSHADVLELGL